MQDIQPELKRIQEKYKNDKEKLNQVTMEFMRENKVNPWRVSSSDGSFLFLLQSFNYSENLNLLLKQQLILVHFFYFGT